MEIDINGLLNLPHVEDTDFTFTDMDVYIGLCRSTKSEPCPICGKAITTVRFIQIG